MHSQIISETTMELIVYSHQTIHSKSVMEIDSRLDIKYRSHSIYPILIPSTVLSNNILEKNFSHANVKPIHYLQCSQIMIRKEKMYTRIYEVNCIRFEESYQLHYEFENSISSISISKIFIVA